MIPDKFTYPFRYVPCDEIRRAAEKLCSEIDGDAFLKSLFSEGKMLGVMLASDMDGRIHEIRAFSGLAGGRAQMEGFAPPLLDCTAPGGYFKQREGEISELHRTDPAAASEASRELQEWLFSHYIVDNACGESLSVKEIFALRGLVPPGGTGECAAPKMLQQAYRNGWKPLAMGEFWYGTSPGKEVREQGRFYPSCTGKCGPLLSWMMKGLDVEPNPLDQLYEGVEPRIMRADEDIIVVVKPAGMLSVPGRTGADSLLEWLQARFGEVHSSHRLDRDTSGVMVFARNLKAKVCLEGQFARREVKKTYRARLTASDKPFRHRAEGTVALPLCLDYDDRPRQMADFENGKKAITQYKVIQTLPNGELEVLFMPLTGRSHQIRVHAAHPSGLGRPIKGDCLYGAPSGERLHLHASSLEFRHPSNDEIIFVKDDIIY